MDPRSEEFLRRIFDVRMLFSGEWMPAINAALLGGPMRYKELLAWVRSVDIFGGWRETPSVISDTSLTCTLQRMVADGLLVREEKSREVPRSVVYSLTPAVGEAVEASVPLAEWAEHHSGLVIQVQRRRSDR